MTAMRRAVTALRAMTVRDVTVVAFAVVAGVGALISFDHIHELVARVGAPPPVPGRAPETVWWAVLYPLSVDGLLVAASLALWIGRQSGGRGSFLAWLSAGLGLVWSLGANLASTNPGLIPDWLLGPAIAVWPPLALALAFELLVSIWRADQSTTGGVGDTGGQTDQQQTAGPDPDRTDDGQTGGPDREQQGGPDPVDQSGGDARTGRRRATGGLSTAGEQDLVERLARVLVEGGKLPSGRSLRGEHGIGPDRVTRIKAAAQDRAAWMRKATGS